MRLRKSLPWQERPSAPYDAIYSLGAACGCALWLRQCHLRLASGPLDWVRTGGGLLGRVALVEAHFKGWLEAENLILLGEDARTRIYRDTALGVEFLHDFPTRIAFPDALRAAQARYRRRQERFYATVATARRTLLVWFDTAASPSDTEVCAALGRLRTCLGAEVELLVIGHAPALPAGEVRGTIPAPGAWVARLNLRTGAPCQTQIVRGDVPKTVRGVLAPFRLRPDLARRMWWFDFRRLLARKARKILAGLVPNRALRRRIREQDRACE